jgi:YgiT-type zinc finger domain-containing protein
VGRTRLQRIAHELVVKRGKQVIIPDLEVEVCDNCGEHIFDLEAARRIEAYKKHSGRFVLQLSPELYVSLSERAINHHRSLNEEINFLLSESLRRAS